METMSIPNPGTISTHSAENNNNFVAEPEIKEVKDDVSDEADFESSIVTSSYDEEEDDDGVLYMKIHSDVDLDENFNCAWEPSEEKSLEIEKFLIRLLAEDEDQLRSATVDLVQLAVSDEVSIPDVSPSVQLLDPSNHLVATICVPSVEKTRPETYEHMLANGTAALFELETLFDLVQRMKDYTVGTISPELLSQGVDECWTRSKYWILAMLEFWNRTADSTQISSSKDFEEVMRHLMGLQQEHPAISQTMRDTEFSLKEFLRLLDGSTLLFGHIRKLSKIVLAEAVPIILPVQKKVFTPTLSPFESHTKARTAVRHTRSTESENELPSIRCGIDGFSIRMKWRGTWAWFKISQMSPRQLINGITMLNRGFHNFALTSFSYARQLEFSLRTYRNSLSRSSILEQAFVSLEIGMKRSAFLFAPEQRDLYRVVQQIELHLVEIKKLAEDIRAHTKSARKMWTSLYEKNNSKLGRKFYNSAQWNLVRELSFSFQIEPPCLFGSLALVHGLSNSAVTEPLAAHANQVVCHKDVGSLIRKRSRRLRDKNIVPEAEDVELCGTAVQLAYLYADYIVSETQVTLDEVMRLNETLFHVHFQNPPINSFCQISIWMLMSAECLFSVQKSCTHEKYKKKIRMEFMRTFHEVEKLVALMERAGEKYSNLGNTVEKMIMGITRRAQEAFSLNTPFHANSGALKLAEVEPEEVNLELEETVETLTEPRMTITEKGLLIHLSKQTFTFSLLPPVAQMKVFQMILHHLTNLLDAASVTYSEALRLAGDSSIPKTTETKDDDSIGKLVEEMQRLFKGFKTMNNLEVIVVTRSLRILEESLVVLRNAIVLKNESPRNPLAHQLTNAQKVYDQVLFRNDSRNSEFCSIAHHLGGELELPVPDRTFQRELERILEASSEPTSAPVDFQKFVSFTKVGKKVDDSLDALDSCLEGFETTTKLMLHPQPHLPLPESSHSSSNDPVFLQDAYSTFLGLALLELNSTPAKFMSTLLRKIWKLERKLEACVDKQKKVMICYENCVAPEVVKFQTVVDPLFDKDYGGYCDIPIGGNLREGMDVEARSSSGDIIMRWDSVRSRISLGYVGYTKFTPFNVSSCSRQERILLTLIKLMSKTVEDVLKQMNNYKTKWTRAQKSLVLIQNFLAGSYISSDQMSRIRHLKERVDSVNGTLSLLQQRLLTLKGNLKVSTSFVTWELAKANSKSNRSRILVAENPAKGYILQLPLPFQVVLWSPDPHK